jgi:outer membrane protein assembly factor BamE
MQMQRPYSKRTTLPVAAFCLLLATALGGCASKNPLMEDSAPLAQQTKPAPAPTAKTESAPPAAPEKPVTAAESATPEQAASAAAAAEPATPAPASTASTNTSTEAGAGTGTNIAAGQDAAAASAATDSAPAAAKTEAPAATASSVRTEKKERFLGFLSPYRPDVQQGNFVSREMVAQLKPGMTQNQVIFLLGTPLLQDVFHQNRWDYVFRMQKGNGDVTTSNVTVYFDNGLVSHYEGGGDLPTEADYLARIADKAKAAKK